MMSKRVMADGSMGEAADGTPLDGWSVIQAESLEAACELASCPHLKMGGDGDVYETMDMSPEAMQ